MRRLSQSQSSPLDTQISGKAGSDVGRPGGCQDAINATALASDKVFKSTGNILKKLFQLCT